MDSALIGARAGYSTQDVEDSIRDYIQNDIATFAKIWRENQEIPVDGEEKAFEPALFSVDINHIKRFHDVHVHSKEDEIRQIDILQEECAELIQALSKMKRIFESNDKQKYYETRKYLIEGLSHVAISSAVVSVQFYISQEDIDEEVQRKDTLMTSDDKKTQSAWDQFWEGVKNLPDTKD